VSIQLSDPSRPAARALTVSQREKLRLRLESDLDDLHGQQETFRSQIETANESRRGVPTDESEDPEGSSLAFEQAQASSMLEQSIRHSLEISHALGKIDAGTYGTCERCESPIAHARLDARPAAALCIACAS
jgi:RNA polymerase-binding transcription factor DksA